MSLRDRCAHRSWQSVLSLASPIGGGGSRRSPQRQVTGGSDLPPLCKGRCPSAHTGTEGLSPAPCPFALLLCRGRAELGSPHVPRASPCPGWPALLPPPPGEVAAADLPRGGCRWGPLLSAQLTGEGEAPSCTISGIPAPRPLASPIGGLGCGSRRSPARRLSVGASPVNPHFPSPALDTFFKSCYADPVEERFRNPSSERSAL